MLAIVAAVLFLIALIVDLAKLALGPLDTTVFLLLGLIAFVLYQAGVGATLYGHRRRRDRHDR